MALCRSFEDLVAKKNISILYQVDAFSKNKARQRKVEKLNIKMSGGLPDFGKYRLKDLVTVVAVAVAAQNIFSE